MTTRKSLFLSLENHLKGINGGISDIASCPFSPYTYNINLSNNVFGKLMFLQQINDFPSLSIWSSQPEIRKASGMEVFGSIPTNLRVSLYGETSSSQTDHIIEDLQYALNSFKYTQENDPSLVDLRITEVSCDEGLLDPYGIVEVSFIVVYKLNI